MDDKPISDLRRRMLEDMAVRRFSEKTKHDYIRHIEAFTRFLGRSPDTATAEDLRRFQVHEMEQGAKPPKMNTQVSALRFFLKTTLGRLDLVHNLARVEYPRKLPRVLSPEDVARLLEAAHGGQVLVSRATEERVMFAATGNVDPIGGAESTGGVLDG